MADEKQVASDIAVAGFASKVTQGGAVVGIAGWLAANWVGVAGVLIAFAGFAVNVYFQRRRDKREEAESQARLDQIRFSRDAS